MGVPVNTVWFAAKQIRDLPGPLSNDPVVEDHDSCDDGGEDYHEVSSSPNDSRYSQKSDSLPKAEMTEMKTVACVKNLQGWQIMPQSVKKIAPLLVETYLGKIPARSMPAATLFCVTFTNN